MARLSAASLSVVAGSIDGRPQPPSDLTEAQAEVWQRTVASESADTFKTAALQQLLRDYCRHVCTAAKLSAMVESLEQLEMMSAEDLSDYDKLLRMRNNETRAIVDKATKLRLTNQARYTPQAAATAAKKASEAKPWQMTA